MPHAIEIGHLRKVYRRPRQPDLVALEDLDLEVREGDIFGFIGPNGAGKSTTIKSLVGLLRPTSGQARVFGHPCGTPESRRHLGYLPETAVYHEFMGVAELLAVHARLAGIPAADQAERCREALRAVRLEDRGPSRLRELSKGMRQRFGIAQALVADPPLLILDEPTSGLDPLAQLEVKDIILKLKGRGITIFFSSHQLTEVELICDRIGILHKGRLLRCGPTADLLEDRENLEIRYRGGGVEAGRLAEALQAPPDLREEGEERLLRVPRGRADAAVDAIRAGGGSLLSLQAPRRTLEEAFFDVIQGAER